MCLRDRLCVLILFTALPLGNFEAFFRLNVFLLRIILGNTFIYVYFFLLFKKWFLVDAKKQLYNSDVFCSWSENTQCFKALSHLDVSESGFT